MRRRALRACLVVAALAAGVLAVEAVLDARSAPPSLAEVAREGSAGGSAAGEVAGEVSASFEVEVLALSGRDGVRVGADGAVVGFSTAQRPEEAFAALAEELSARGWERVESGLPALGSFVKGEGAYRWVLVSCSPSGAGSSVVVQCASGG